MNLERVSMSDKAFPIGSLGIIAMKGFEDFAEKVDKWLIEMHMEQFGTAPDSFIIKSRCPRFANGEGKGIIDETVRGKDLYILTDVGNYNVTYPIMGMTNHMSPDDHYQDLKRIIYACSGRAKKIHVIMPLLYNGRQHKRMVRESLDCAEAMRELADLGVENVITFDAHDSRVQNAIPHMGFENGAAYYQFIKALIHEVPDVKFDKEHTAIVSPDEGAIHRNLFYASIFGLDLGVFYKVRDYGRIENGRNPIIAHEYIGRDVEGKDIIVVDDILSSGESMLDIAYELKRRKAKRVFSMVTYPLFTSGVEKFDKCYADGMIDKVISTNLTYRRPELANKPWFVEADMTKYVAKIIDALNYDESLANLINPAQRVINLMERVKNGEKI